MIAVLLYLNDTTFLGADGEALAQEVRRMRGDGIVIVVVHENDGGLGGCPFRRYVCTRFVALADVAIRADASSQEILIYAANQFVSAAPLPATSFSGATPILQKIWCKKDCTQSLRCHSTQGHIMPSV